MKLAYFSPLNPQPSGISDYSEELLPSLAAHAEIDLFLDGFKAVNTELLARFRSFDYQSDPTSLVQLQDYDAIIYHMGNDHRYHSGIFEVMRRHPGIVVFHDFALQDFFFGLARSRSNNQIYLDELEACHGSRQRSLAAEHLTRGSVPPQLALPLNFPLNCGLARTADGIITHSEWGRARFAVTAPGVPVAHVPMGVRPPPSKTAGTGATLASFSRQLQIASFGLITPGKGIEHTLRALNGLRQEFDFHYTLVGADNPYFDVRSLIKSYDMEDRVTITGHVQLEKFERCIAETDIAVNLRERTVGETSASLCRILASGVASIVADVGWYSELPGNCVVKVPIDEYTDATLVAYLNRLMEDADLRARIAANAQHYALAEHSVELSAAGYLSFIDRVVAARPRKRLLQGISSELSVIGVRATNDSLLRSVAEQVAVLAPANKSDPGAPRDLLPARPSTADNGNRDNSKLPTAVDGRLPKIEGIDYKRAAIEYPRKLDAERNHYLSTKPFYNLANKPVKHLGDGMDVETHRHFTDFANIAVALALPAGAEILDVGCGSGWLSEYFARLGYDVTGIDISPDLIRMARERIERVPYDVDHETKLRCRFLIHDVELELLFRKFDAIVCYDSLHHFVDERKVFRNLAAMLDVGGLLFVLEGHKPSSGSATEDELREVMLQYGTLESPFSNDYLRTLLDEHGLAVVGDYVSVNGLFEREMLEGDRLSLQTLDTDYHYLTSIKVADGATASSVPDSRKPGLLRALFTLRGSPPSQVESGTKLDLEINIRNAGDTLWRTGQTLRTGVVMPGVRVIDERGEIIDEVHGHPMLPRSVAPGQTIAMRIPCPVPSKPGTYTIKIDLVDQHVCWFEEAGSKPLLFSLEVRERVQGSKSNVQSPSAGP